MAVNSVVNPTIMDLKNAVSPDGSIAQVIEMLHQQNDMLVDAAWVECNNKTSHISSVRTGIPTPTWRKLYGGVQPTKSTRAQVTDSTGMLEDYAEVDKALVDLQKHAAAFRLSEDSAHVEGLNQAVATTVLYGNEGTANSQFTGLSPRFNSKSAVNGVNIVDAGGTGADNTSIWLIVWGPQTVHMIYPEGFPAGIEVEDKGVVTIENADGSNGRMEAYRTHYAWKCGLAVRDWRYVVRIANIDLSDLKKDPNGDAADTVGGGADLLDLMAQAIELPPSLNAGRAAFYCSKTIRSMLRRQARMAVMNSTLSLENIAGRKFVTFDGVPVGRLDSILHTETRVT